MGPAALLVHGASATRMYTRWVSDILDNQASNGELPEVAPGPVLNDGYNGAWWGGMGVWGPAMLYGHSGDAALDLAPAYDKMRAYVVYLNATADARRDVNWGLGDWLAVSSDCMNNATLINTPALALYAGILADAAALLAPSGAAPPGDAALFAALAASVRDSYFAQFFDGNAIAPGEQCTQALALGLDRFERVVVFHSLSKRTSVPGMRSGFVAGDPALIAPYRLYRTYHGCALPGYVQVASTLAWNDDAHAADNRRLYAAKFQAVAARLAGVLPVTVPAGAFYLWTDVSTDDTVFARELYRTQNVIVLPGTFLARNASGTNPGAGRIRISLVAPLADCVQAADRIVDFLGDFRR